MNEKTRKVGVLHRLCSFCVVDTKLLQAIKARYGAELSEFDYSWMSGWRHITVCHCAVAPGAPTVSPGVAILTRRTLAPSMILCPQCFETATVIDRVDDQSSYRLDRDIVASEFMRSWWA